MTEFLRRKGGHSRDATRAWQAWSPGQDSVAGGLESALGEERVEGLDGGGAVALVLSLALAVGGTLSFEGPREADGLTIVLGDSSVLS